MILITRVQPWSQKFSKLGIRKNMKSRFIISLITNASILELKHCSAELEAEYQSKKEVNLFMSSVHWKLLPLSVLLNFLPHFWFSFTSRFIGAALVSRRQVNKWANFVLAALLMSSFCTSMTSRSHVRTLCCAARPRCHGISTVASFFTTRLHYYSSDEIYSLLLLLEALLSANIKAIQEVFALCSMLR